MTSHDITKLSCNGKCILCRPMLAWDWDATARMAEAYRLARAVLFMMLEDLPSGWWAL